jgi:hypothetical protein
MGHSSTPVRPWHEVLESMLLGFFDSGFRVEALTAAPAPSLSEHHTERPPEAVATAMTSPPLEKEMATTASLLGLQGSEIHDIRYNMLLVEVYGIRFHGLWASGSTVWA